jgi:nucleoside-diphosphate-sugar epimerase
MVKSEQKYEPVPANCAVIGGTGFVGRRLVEMLVERGAERVVSFDIVPPPEGSMQDSRIQYEIGDIRDADRVAQVCKGIDCVWHIAACVGPYHPKQLYTDVNYTGTLNVLEACRTNKINKLVMSSSPSTRFDGKDVDGLTEAEMPSLPQVKRDGSDANDRL